MTERRKSEEIRKILKEYIETPSNYENGSMFITDIARGLGMEYKTMNRNLKYMYDHSMLDPRVVYVNRGRYNSIFFRHYLPAIKQSEQTENGDENYEKK